MKPNEAQLICSYFEEFDESIALNPFLMRFVVGAEKFEIDLPVPSVAILLEGSSATLISESLKKNIVLDHRVLAVVPKHTKLELISRRSIVKIVLVGFGAPSFEETAQEYKLDPNEVAESVTKIETVQATSWIVELVHRYIFERAIAKQPESAAAHFCLIELLKEIHYRLPRRNAPSEKGRAKVDRVPNIDRLPQELQKAIVYIESNLSSEISVSEISRASGASPSKTARLFRDWLGKTPGRYLWSRRLHEAKLLLLTGRVNPSEASFLTGFGDLASFSSAFQREFGVRPSELKPT